MIDGGGPALARDMVARILSSEEVAPGVIDDAVLLTSELVTNAMRHARLPPSVSMQLLIRVEPDSIRIDVADEGIGFSRASVPLQGGPEGGWGLVLVDLLADRWGVTRNQPNLVWFELHR